MSAASGGVDVKEVGNTIAGLAKREFVLRRAGKDHPEVFTTRWAMSYLRGPLTRDQIALLMTDQKALANVASAGSKTPTAGTDAGVASVAPPGEASTGGSSRSEAEASPAALATDETNVLPEIAAGVMVRWADVASPWLTTIGGDTRGARYEASIVGRVALRYDDEKADLVHDEEYEAVIFPLAEPVDPTRSIADRHPGQIANCRSACQPRLEVVRPSGRERC